MSSEKLATGVVIASGFVFDSIRLIVDCVNDEFVIAEVKSLNCKPGSRLEWRTDSPSCFFNKSQNVDIPIVRILGVKKSISEAEQLMNSSS